MAKEVNKAAAEDAAATSTQAEETKAVETVEVKETEKVEATAKVVFKATDGTKHELLVKKFLFKGQRYESEVAVKENKDVLEHLVSLNSRIFKKV